jgi:hypothetical protein
MERHSQLQSRISHPISRRSFLSRSAGAGALLFAVGCVGEGGEDYAALLGPGERPVSLPVREFAVLKAVARRLVPGDAGRPNAEDLGVASRIDRELSFHPVRFAIDLRDALRLIEWWPLATRFSRFTRLAAEQQDEVLGDMLASRFALRRAALQGVKILVMFFHYTQEPTWPAIGYDGPWVPRVPPASLA